MRQLENGVSKSFCINRSENIDNNYSNKLLSSWHVPGAVLITLGSSFHLILVLLGVSFRKQNHCEYFGIKDLFEEDLTQLWQKLKTMGPKGRVGGSE